MNRHPIVVVILLFLFQTGLKAFAIDSKIALHEINNQKEFDLLSASPETSTLARTQLVKFMIDRKRKRKVWFFNTEKYTYHYAFARRYLHSAKHPVPDHSIFNAREYSHNNRRFEMGSIIYYKDQDRWVLQLMAGDNLNAQEIVVLFKQIKNSLWIGKQLYFLPANNNQAIALRKINKKIPIVTSGQIFNHVKYQPLTQGRAVGYLRVVRGDLDQSTVRPDQILVLEKLPGEIPVSAGVISQELQAPLSHIALLCGARGTPNMGLRNALTNQSILDLDGQLVELHVLNQEFILSPTNIADAKKYWNKNRPDALKIPVADLTERRLLDASLLRSSDAVFAGAKAAQLGEVSRIKGVITPGGFVLPLFYYFKHMEKIESHLTGSLNDDVPLFDRYKKLEHLRNAIKSIDVDSGLIKSIKTKMAQTNHSGRWILRSSTNAEDLAGFNGAGLYRSIKIKANQSDEELKSAILEVWASVWSQGAFDEREWFGVNHRAVGMAILVQPFVEGAIANGVAITANPFAEFRPGLLINVEPFSGSVTGAEGNQIPEQHLVYTFDKQLDFELLSTSSKMPEGETVLTQEALTELSNQLVQLHQYFVSPWNNKSNAVDVEFLVMADQKVVILQARPYKVAYSKEQRL